ncbi:MAG: hypothetical protein CNIPEHKO_03170 [Anaerolineales bacterium]|nr:hypothetical protein [Anaerolineales bacterium]
MKKYIFLSLIFVFILSCSTVAAPTGKAGETESASPSASEASASPTPVPPTAISLPTFTPTPASRVASPENIGEFVQGMEYGDLIDEYIGMSLFDGRIHSSDYSQDGRTLALGICLEFLTTVYEWNCQGASVVVIMDALTGELIQKIEYAVRETPASLSFSPDGKKLLMLVGNINHAFLTLLDVETGKQERTYIEKKGDFYDRPSAFFSPDGRLIAYSHDDVVDNTLDMLQASDGKILYSRENYLGGGKFSPDSTRFYSHAYDPETGLGYIFGLDLRTWQDAVRMIPDEKYSGEGWFDEISPNGKWVVFWHRVFPLFVHDLESGELVAEISIPASEDKVDSISFTPDGRLMFADGAFVWDPDYVDSSPPVLNAWNTSTWEHAAAVYGSSRASEYVIFDASGESFITIDQAETMRFTLPDAGILAAQASVEKYLNAISAGDYVTAADMLFLPEDSSAYETVVSNGFDPADMPAALEALCAQDDFPCLPLREIVLGYREAVDEDGVMYRFLVTFTAPDGSLFIAPDDTSEFFIWVGADGKIMSLHPGSYEGW